MSLSKMIGVMAMAALVDVTTATIGATVNAQGVTQLYGDSFGIQGINRTFDYIIVGGGNAGNAIAARLAMDPANYTVAVIEAGNFYEIMNGNVTQIPAYSFKSVNPSGSAIASVTDVGLATAPQAGYNGRSLFYTIGQAFGGGTAANFGGYVRPTVGTMDWWAKLVGDDYWKWDNVYPFYKKSVDFTPPNYEKIDPSLNITYDATAFEDGAGPLHVSYGNWQGPYGPYLEEAYVSLGLDASAGFNSGNMIGYGTATGVIDTTTATRDSSETSFLQAGITASRLLTVYPNTLAKKVVFDSNKKATGVEVTSNMANVALSWQLTANKEVIVSAGVWNSPKLLMLSGVGPSATLGQHGIETIADLPGVGQNQRDSPFVTLVFKANVTTNTQWIAGNPAVVEEVESQYINNQSGRLTGLGTGQGLAAEHFPAHLRSSFSNSTLGFLKTFPEDWPEVQYLPLESSAFPADLGPDDNYMSIGSALLSTSSIGNMTISSNNVLDDPIISPNWLLDSGDLEMAVAAFKRVREIASNTSIIESEFIPGPTVSTDAEITEWLKNNMALIYHGSSTCKMGSSNDTMAVLDSRARVRGVTGLRVVDASSFPNLPPGYPMSAVYMYAEAIAASILSGN